MFTIHAKIEDSIERNIHVVYTCELVLIIKLTMLIITTVAMTSVDSDNDNIYKKEIYTEENIFVACVERSEL